MNKVFLKISQNLLELNYAAVEKETLTQAPSGEFDGIWRTSILYDTCEQLFVVNESKQAVKRKHNDFKQISRGVFKDLFNTYNSALLHQ